MFILFILSSVFYYSFIFISYKGYFIILLLISFIIGSTMAVRE